MPVTDLLDLSPVILEYATPAEIASQSFVEVGDDHEGMMTYAVPTEAAAPVYHVPGEGGDHYVTQSSVGTLSHYEAFPFGNAAATRGGMADSSV